MGGGGGLSELYHIQTRGGGGGEGVGRGSVDCRIYTVRFLQGVTKRCRLFRLANSALVYEPKCVEKGGLAGSQPMSRTVHRSPNKLWRSTVTPYFKYGFLCGRVYGKVLQFLQLKLLTYTTTVNNCTYI